MSNGGNVVDDPRVAELRQQFQQGTIRFFRAFALAEGLVLAIAVLLIWVLQLIDPEVGVYIVVAIAALGGITLFLSLRSRLHRYQQDLADLTGAVAP